MPASARTRAFRLVVTRCVSRGGLWWQHALTQSQDFRSEGGLYSLIQAQFDAASRELEKREEERDGRSSPPLTEAAEERPSKWRKLSLEDVISVKSEPSRPAEREHTKDTADRIEDQQTPRAAQSTANGPDQQVADCTGNSIVVDDGMSIRVATESGLGVEESIVVRGDTAMDGSGSGSGPESPDSAFGGVTARDGASTSVVTGLTTTAPHESPGLPARKPEDDLTTTTQPDLGLLSNSGPLTNLTNLSSSPRASTPRISHLSSDLDHHPTYPFSSSPLSSPPPILSDPYESSSLERTYSQSDSVSTTSVSSSAESEETDPSGESSGSSTPYLTSQTSLNSSQSRTSLPNLKGRDLFDASIWADPIKTSVFYTFATTLRQKARNVSPTTSHFFLNVLRDQRKLVRCYTQNIDRIEHRIGLSTSLDLGAGSRSRFSAKAWRSSGAPGGPVQGHSRQGEGSVASGGERIAQVVVQDPASDAHDRAAADGGAREDHPGQIQQGRGVPAGRGPRASAGAPEPGTGPSPPGNASSVLPRPAPEVSHYSQGPAASVRASADQPEVPLAQSTIEPDPGGGGGAQRRLQLPHQRAGGGAPGPAPSALPSAPPSQGPTLSAPNRGVECVFLHGSLESLRCFLCGLTSSWDDAERELETLAGRQPTCPHCAGATAAREEKGKRALGVGKLRPDIVLYGEEHPQSDMIGNIVQHDLSLVPDMLLILGTSLRVHGLKTVVREFAKAVHSKGGKVVFVNFTKPPDSVWSDIIDFWVQSDCDAWVTDMKARKPALWMPPGTAPSDEETKASKGKRMSNGGSLGIRRTSSGVSVTSDKDAAAVKNSKGPRKSNGGPTKPRRKNSNLSFVEESVHVSGAPSAKNSSSSDDLSPNSPSVSYISQGLTANPGTTAVPAGKSRGRRPPHSLLIRQVLESMPERKDRHGPSPSGIAKVEMGVGNMDKQAKVTAKRSRKSLPTGSGVPPAAPRETKLNPNAKRPQSTRDEVFNAAYLSWKILVDLKRLTGQPDPRFLYSTAPPPAPKVARPRKPRQSAPAVLSSGSVPLTPAAPSSEPAKLQSMEEGSLPYPRPPAHLGVRLLPGEGASQPSPLMFMPGGMPPVSRYLPAMPLSLPARSPLVALPSALDAKPGKAKDARSKKVRIPSPPLIKDERQPLSLTSTSTVPVVSPTSIGAAIKSNPRKRKRKTIDGVKVVLPGEGRRLTKPRASLPVPARPQTPSLDTAPVSHPQTPHIYLPPPQPSATPVTPSFEVAMDLERFREGLALPSLHDETPPEVPSSGRLEAMEPRPRFGPLPASYRPPHKLGDFFLGPGRHQIDRVLATPFEHFGLGDHNPFFLADPLSSLAYPSRPGSAVEPSRTTSPNLSPSDQLRSDEEAALALSMLLQQGSA